MSIARVAGKGRAAAIYTVLTLLLGYPISIWPDRIAWADDPDEHLVMWLLAWDAHAFVTSPLAIFDANTFYPERRTLAYQENLIGSAFFAAPVLWLTDNPVLATNFVSLLACVLCGLGAYVLARRMGIGEPGALLCGVIFAFSPPRFLRFPQTHLAVVQWIPFALAALHGYFEDGRRRDLLLAVGFFTLQVMSSGHAGVFLVVAIALMLLYRVVLGEPILLRKRVRDFGLAGALLLLPAALFVIPYRINQVEQGLRRGLSGWNTPIDSFFASPARVVVSIQSMITNRNIRDAADAWLFPGFLPTALALVAIGAGAAALVRRGLWPAGRSAAGSVSIGGFARQNRAFVAVLGVAVLTALSASVTHPFLRAGDGLSVERASGPATILTGYLTVGNPGLYNFGMTADERSQLTIDSVTVIDHGRHRPDAPRTGSVTLSEGSHRVLVEYAMGEEQPPLEWTWAPGSSPEAYRPVPGWLLSRRPVTYASAVTARTVSSVGRIAGIVAALAVLWRIGAWLSSRRHEWTARGATYRSSPTPLYLLITVVCIALALGPPYGLWQYVYWLPGFNFIRGSSRFMVLGLLGIAMLAAVGFERVASGLAPRTRSLAAGVLIALMAAEFASQPFSTPYTFSVPAADRWVAQQPKPFVVAEVPSRGGYARLQTMYMLHSMAHWQKTVHGYGGLRPYRHNLLYEELDAFPDTRSVEHLLTLGVNYVIVHTDLYPPDQWAAASERLGAFGDQLELVYSDAESRVFALRRETSAARSD